MARHSSHSDAPQADRDTLLGGAADSITDVFLVVDLQGVVRYVNAAIERVLGFSPHELLGEPLTTIIPEHLRERHLRGLRRYLETGQRRIPWSGVEFAGRHKRGHEVQIEVSLASFTLDGQPYLTGVLREVSTRDRAVRWLATHRWVAVQYAASRAIAESEGLVDGPPRLLRAIAEALGWELAELWLVDGSAEALTCAGRWTAGVAEDVDDSVRLARGQSLPGRVWEHGRPEWLENARRPGGVVRSSLVHALGIRSGVAAPLRHAGRIVGVLALFSVERLAPDRGLLELLPYLADQVGDFLARVRTEEELRRREERFRALVEYADDAVALVDAKGQVGYVSHAVERILGYAPDGLLGTSGFTLIHPDDLPRTRALFEEALARPGLAVRAELRCLHKDGVWRVLEGVAVNRLEERAVGAVVVNFRDITDRKRAEAALQESEQRYALATRGANDGLWDWDLVTGTIFYSTRWKTMLGYAEDEIGGDPEEWLGRIHPDDVAAVRAALDEHLSGRSPHLACEHRIGHKDGTYLWVLCRSLAVRDPDGRPLRMAGSLTDITQRKQVERHLFEAAMRDALTNVPNRAWFEKLLSRAVERASRETEYAFAVLFLDLDRFKVVNDSLGHMVGDELLLAVARRLKRCVRPGDVVARLGGDEFAVLLQGPRAPTDAADVAERIIDRMARPFEALGHEVFTGVSIGVTDSTSGDRSATDVLRDADLAMYRAKVIGPGRYQQFDAALRTQVLTVHEMETGLRRALDREEFVLHFQPVMTLTTHRVVGFEALVRWQDPSFGLRPPGDFIHLAEETGLIVPLGDWVLRRACAQMRAWQDRFTGSGRLTVSVNIAGRQLRQPDFVERVVAALEHAGLDPTSLTLEISESAIIEEPEAAARKLTRLRELGVRVELDAFGTGYSSLSYLHRLPVDTLKIDRSFVGRMSDSRKNRQVVRGIATLARTLGIEVIAAGVETVEQLSALRGLKFRFGQGFLLAEPADAKTVERLLSPLRRRR